MISQLMGLFVLHPPAIVCAAVDIHVFVMIVDHSLVKCKSDKPMLSLYAREEVILKYPNVAGHVVVSFGSLVATLNTKRRSEFVVFPQRRHWQCWSLDIRLRRKQGREEKIGKRAERRFPSVAWTGPVRRRAISGDRIGMPLG